MRTSNLMTIATLLVAGASLAGCETHTGTGAAVGAAGGAVVSGLSGGSRMAGAAIGAAGGAIVGGAVDRDVNSGKCFERGVEVVCPPLPQP